MRETEPELYAIRKMSEPWRPARPPLWQFVLAALAGWALAWVVML